MLAQLAPSSLDLLLCSVPVRACRAAGGSWVAQRARRMLELAAALTPARQ